MATVTAIPELGDSLKLASELLEMTRGSSKAPLSDWLVRAEARGSRLVQSFAEALRTDAAAVQAELSTSWSNGPVEGQVNRLKTIKRSMYGRAGLALLRARVRAKLCFPSLRSHFWAIVAELASEARTEDYTAISGTSGFRF
ncbi:transposase [Gemmata sp. G18]|uniref:Transposase n=1 Tax=Gemmata palustris TaxID=2822762 RepID=A0ABS5BVY5_9BACT|nr:transposase [Gemmata palustris]